MVRILLRSWIMPVLAVFVLTGCGSAGNNGGNDGGTGDVDSDADTDSDTDTDTDTDADTDSDTGTGTDTDTDTDGDIDSDSDTDTDDTDTGCVDQDEDEWCEEFDCNDTDSNINPDIDEIPDNTVDDDCDGLTDEEDDDGGMEECVNELQVVWHDFDVADDHPDFHCHMGGSGITYGLVLDTLDADRKPQYNPDIPDITGGSNPMITSADTFYDWFHDTPANTVSTGTLPLTEDPYTGLFGYASDHYEIVPGEGGFTTEIHSEFVYEQGQVFSFLGDDDVWIFIDGKLAVDIGGLHQDETGSVNLDDLGLTPGKTYNIDMFHAERCYGVSHFKLETSIPCFSPVVVK
jgi:fibro-slime domain-containing protein